MTLNTRQLAGGKSLDYVNDILETLEDLSSLYAEFLQLDKEDVLCMMKARILSTLTDRAAANHATVENLGRSLLELNCQLHPLDGLANAVRSVLKAIHQEKNARSISFGSDCQASNVLHLISKLRYKAKGDPSGFKAHLHMNGLSCGRFVRYVGNRLHGLFHLAGTVFQHRELLLQFAEVCNNSQMSSALKADLRQTLLLSQLQSLGLLGKIVTGPWMALFYTCMPERKHLEMSEYLKSAVSKLEDQADELFSCQTDIFGRPLVVDETLMHLRVSDNLPELSSILSRLIGAFLKVLRRRLVRYLYGELQTPQRISWREHLICCPCSQYLGRAQPRHVRCSDSSCSKCFRAVSVLPSVRQHLIRQHNGLTVPH